MSEFTSVEKRPKNPGGRARSVQATHGEWARWQASADRHGMKMQTWMRHALKRQCDLEEALLNMEAAEREKGLLVDRTNHDQA